MKSLGYIVLASLLILCSTGVASAQENALSLSLFPPVIEISTDPPSKIEAKITIQNRNENPELLNIVFRSFKPSEVGNGQIEYLNEDTIQGPDPLIIQKIKVFDGDKEVKDVNLEPFESKELKLNINLEAGAPTGDYYFSVIFASNPKTSDTSGASVPGGIGTNVILSVGKKGPTKGGIAEFTTPYLLSRGPVPLTLAINNTGEQYFIPTGRIVIKNMLGREVGRLDILPQYVLSGAKRYMVDTNQASPSAALQELVNRFSANNNVIIWPEKFLLGPYTAEAVVKLSNSGPVFRKSIVFVALPIYIVAAVAFVAFILLGIYLKVKKRI